MSRENAISGKRRAGLSADDKRLLRDALHTEGCLSGCYADAVRVRVKLGLGPLAGEREETHPSCS